MKSSAKSVSMVKIAVQYAKIMLNTKERGLKSAANKLWMKLE
jgi:hypothetical protein